jgi:choline dehydrogenase-like flavoprotein
MLIDARSIPAGEIVDADLCIVGGGAAGITMALQFANHSARVVLLEGGALTPDAAAQRLCAGTTTGHSYYPLDTCRLRMLGGSTHFWGGWCRPLDALDFEEREWVPHSGWPFSRQHLDAEYKRAEVICRLQPVDYDSTGATAAEGTRWLSAPSECAADTTFQIAPARFGDAYRSALQRAHNVRLMLGGNVVELEMDRHQRGIDRVQVATLGGHRFSVAARIFVLAAGGIENPRILLASRRARACGIGNEHDLVGRFFGDHLHVPVGTLVPLRRAASSFYRTHDDRGARLRGGIVLTERVTRKERLPGFAITLHDADDPHDVLSPTHQHPAYESLQLLTRSLLRGTIPHRFMAHSGNVAIGLDAVVPLLYRRLVRSPGRRFTIGARAEQLPNPNNRVTLDACQDDLGMPRVRIEWTISRDDVDGLQRARRLLLGALDRTRATIVPCPAEHSDRWADSIKGGAHHIGTTRMHRDPSHGVVDEHCRVHSTSNLYVAGSSVFPTSGWAPPTLTIVALTLKLADHVKRQWLAA